MNIARRFLARLVDADVPTADDEPNDCPAHEPNCDQEECDQ